MYFVKDVLLSMKYPFSLYPGFLRLRDVTHEIGFFFTIIFGLFILEFVKILLKRFSRSMNNIKITI
jgi:hypothetical protein